METWTVKKILDWGIGYFDKKDIPQARLSAELLLASVLRLTRMELYLNHSRVLKPDELAAYKKHIGFYPDPSGIEKFKDALSEYESGRGSVKFPLNKPVPYDLIGDIVKFRVRENSEKAAKKKR